jgi:hypothetical protein
VIGKVLGKSLVKVVAEVVKTPIEFAEGLIHETAKQLDPPKKRPR